jgi:hypothetical protein
MFRVESPAAELRALGGPQKNVSDQGRFQRADFHSDSAFDRGVRRSALGIFPSRQILDRHDLIGSRAWIHCDQLCSRGVRTLVSPFSCAEGMVIRRGVCLVLDSARDHQWDWTSRVDLAAGRVHSRSHNCPNTSRNCLVPRISTAKTGTPVFARSLTNVVAGNHFSHAASRQWL